MEEEYKSLGSVPLGVIEKAIASLRADHAGYSEEAIKRIPVSFEYLVGSFFPEVLSNIKEEANRQYTKGFIEGLRNKEF
jgi:hypothetical protein